MSISSAPTPLEENYNLGLSRCSSWLAQARSLWVEHPFFFLALAALVVVLRRTLDVLGMDVFIIVSYLTDAWIFSWLVLGVSQASEGSAWSMVRAGGLSMWGRLFAVLKTILWGIPSALTSYVIFLLVPEGIQALVVIQGNVLLATSLLFASLVVGGFISMLLALLPVLAAIQMARDPHATLMSSGLWAYRGVHAGIRPLAVLFVLFLFSALVCNALTTWLLGHLPVEVFSDWTADDILEALYQAPTTTFLVMNAFLALLPSMANDLLRSADIDLSDEIFSDEDKVIQGDAFGIRILEHAGHGLRLLSMLSIVFLVIYVWFSGYSQAIKWSVLALATHQWGGSFRKSAQAWRHKGAWHLRYRFVITPLLMLVALVGFAVIFDSEE